MLTQYQLKNKLKVLLVESHKAPVVAVQMWVKTGSADEKKGQEGISHFIEHLVFKGTRKYGVGEVARAVEGAGGELNAYTTFDHTVFHVTMSRDDLATGLDCIAEMMGFPRFDPEEIDREREVVLEEIKRSFDNPHSVASQQLFSTVFKKHAYGIPVIGYSKNIKTVSPKVLTDYYHRRYVPSNMTLVVAGDFPKDKIKKMVAQYYGDFKPFKLSPVKRKRETKQSQIRLDYHTSAFQEATLNVAFRAPKADGADVPALDILALVLGQGDSSRLVRRLRLEKPLVTSVSAGSFNPLDPGLFAVTAQFKAENIFEIQKIILEELKTLCEKPLTETELKRARLNLEAEEIFSLETVDGLARKVGVFQTLLNDPKYIQKYLKKVRALTSSEILKTARKYFDPKALCATLMISKEDSKVISKAAFQKLAKEIQAALAGARKAPVKIPRGAGGGKGMKVPGSLKLESGKNNIEKFRLPGGGLAILKRNPEVPLIHLKAGFLGGLRMESQNNLGVTTLLSNAWTAGSGKYSEDEIAGIIEGCAGSLSSFGGRNSIGMTMESLSSHEKQALEVFSDVLVNPRFPEEAIEREIRVQKEYLRTREDHPSSVAAQLFLENIFAGHPYSWDILGSENSLNTMNQPAVAEHWGKMANRSNVIFVAVGNFDSQKQLDVFKELEAQLKSGEKRAESFPLGPLKEDKKVFQKSEKEQTHIIVGYRGLSFTDPDRYVLDVLEAIMAGQGGRLFLELRDKASLAYTVSPVNMKGIEGGYFGVYIGCSPEKGPKAVDMIGIELEKIVNQAPSEAEVQRAKRYLIGRNHIDLQRNGAQASSILFDELYGVDCEETFRFAEHLHQITADDVHRVARKIFQAPSVSVAVGPQKPF